MAEVLYGRLKNEWLVAAREFCLTNWESEHPLIHNAEMFDYYYRDEGDINIVIAYTDDEKSHLELSFINEAEIVRTSPKILGICGYIKTNSSNHPDVFISYILTKKGLHFGMAFRLIEKIRRLTNARTLSCNNIRKKTRGIYDFLEYSVGDMAQWYRLNNSIANYSLCNISCIKVEPIKSSEIVAKEVFSSDQMLSFPFESFSNNRPFKDNSYVEKRFIRYPWHIYRIFWLSHSGKNALLVIREILWQNSKMLRIVDFIGDRELIKDSGIFLDRLLKECQAEFIDWYSFGVAAEDMKQAGFTLRDNSDNIIIPMYYSPLIMRNYDVTVFTSDPENYMMFRADGDQDRPNLG